MKWPIPKFRTFLFRNAQTYQTVHANHCFGEEQIGIGPCVIDSAPKFHTPILRLTGDVDLVKGMDSVAPVRGTRTTTQTNGCTKWTIFLTWTRRELLICVERRALQFLMLKWTAGFRSCPTFEQQLTHNKVAEETALITPRYGVNPLLVS